MTNDAIYVPAVTASSHWKLHPDFKYKNHDLLYFTEDSFFKHSHVLINAYYNMDVSNVRKEYNIPDDVVIIGDSGGFQLASLTNNNKSVDIVPINILRWLENNTTIGMNLDSPATKDFNVSMRTSIKNFELFEKHRENYSFKLYNVLHGRSLNEIKTWYNSVKDFNFDGWGIGVASMSQNIFLKILGYLVLHESGENNLLNNCHFFGISSISSMVALAILAKRFNTDITFDSSSYAVGRYRKYFIPGSVNQYFIMNRSKSCNIKDPICNCPVCRNITVEELYDQDNWYTEVLFYLHNIYQTIEMNKRINILADDMELLSTFSDFLGVRKIFDTVNHIIDLYEKSSAENVFNTFSIIDRKLFMYKCKSLTQLTSNVKNLGSY